MTALLIVFLAMLLVPALIWAGFWYAARGRQLLRLAAAIVLPPVIAEAGLVADAANSPDDKGIGPSAYFLVFIFPLIMSIGVAGFCEAWAGKKRKQAPSPLDK